MKSIKLVVSDWDGVFNSVKYYGEFSNVVLKTYKDVDMTAIKCFNAMGVDFVVLSGDPWNKNICDNRKIKMYESRNSEGILDKKSVIKSIMQEYGVNSGETLYIGDDVFDIPAMEEVEHISCPRDASYTVLQYFKTCGKNCIYLDRCGGEGCLDELFYNCMKRDLLSENKLNYEKLLLLDKRQMT
jgi:3-deoxy-D-manno-octulosonate 8-phosphate phosphatase KdsC-like HAD superfamily phosphatase